MNNSNNNLTEFVQSPFQLIVIIPGNLYLSMPVFTLNFSLNRSNHINTSVDNFNRCRPNVFINRNPRRTLLLVKVFPAMYKFIDLFVITRRLDMMNHVNERVNVAMKDHLI
ncbi:hypothetical protein T10_1778 [Trichinella papuae]|uniref:Uncharacterized protein n=1 Tax=Trichinella papuae TaxID=268474 RepID=A0A0V1M945_9BILA|nr:hypothetical protein T10_11736 [Trichinella papuae]KRZ68340.1 hypothetical protein T10_8498 [Trichinella papuae]KRZ68344.1 hypothetical protein T10_1778 [Trichinella papuae]